MRFNLCPLFQILIHVMFFFFFSYSNLTVDGYRRCEKWMRNDVVDSKESKTTSWFKRFIGREQKPEVTWPFPFVEGRMFVLTLLAGVDGYHINVGGRHITSFPYRTVSHLK